MFALVQVDSDKMPFSRTNLANVKIKFILALFASSAEEVIDVR